MNRADKKGVSRVACQSRWRHRLALAVLLVIALAVLTSCSMPTAETVQTATYPALPDPVPPEMAEAINIARAFVDHTSDFVVKPDAARTPPLLNTAFEVDLSDWCEGAVPCTMDGPGRAVVFWTTNADMTRSRILVILDAQNKVQFAHR